MKTDCFFISILAAVAFVFTGCTSHSGTSSESGGADSVFIAEIERDYAMGEFIDCMNTIKDYLSEIEAGEREPHPEVLARAYKLLGNVHIQYEDFSAAEKYYNLGISFADRLKDQTDHLKLLHNLTINSITVRNREKAMECHERVDRVQNADKGLQRYYWLLESAYIESVFGDKEKAIGIMRQVIDCVDENRLPQEFKNSPIGEISEWLADMGRYAEALEAISELENRLDSASQPNMRLGCLKSYSKIYALMGDSDRSSQYRQMYMELNDSLMNRNRFLKARSSFNEAGRELKSGREKTLATEVRFYRWFSVGVIVVLWGCGVMVWIWKRRHRRSDFATGPGDSSGVLEDDDIPGRAKLIGKQKDDVATLFFRISSAMNERDNYSDPHFSIERLAQMLDSNTKYVSRAVNTITGENFRTYLNGIRIREVKLRLDSVGPDEEVSIREIASSVGFMSQSAFIAAFKKATGSTPSGYLKSVHESR